MAETLISPGTLARESDQSQITSQPIEVGAALIGPTVKGKVGIPRVVTSYSEYLSYFGSTFESGSNTYSFLTSISAYNYFSNGGTSLLVTRVTSGSFSPATSTFISASDHSAGGNYSSSVFVLETLSDGLDQNSNGTEKANGLLITKGSKDNIRWEIVNPDTGSGTFTVLIRRGDDRTKVKNILETFPNVSLDPKASNYIARIIGDQTQTLKGSGTSEPYLQTTGSFPNASRYVRVKEVNQKTPDYLNADGSAKDQYTGSIPLAASGTMEAGSGRLFNGVAGNFYDGINNTNTQGLIGSSYTDAINLMSNKEEYKYKVITIPGLIYSNATHATPLNTLIEIVENRGDAIAVVDLENYSSTPTSATSTAASLDSSYAAAYWPWVQITDPDTQQLVWVPASTLIPGVYAYNDRVSEPWFAPAGINRGGLTLVRQAERKLRASDKDKLYQGKVNALATVSGRGVVAMGQKTLQTAATALDRVNVRRLLIELKSFITQVSDTLVFEQNTIATRNSFLSQVNPYLESVQQRNGLYAYKVVMDDSNNTADVIDRNQLLGAIYIQPTKTAEFIYLDFNILPTGVEFPS